ncbi:TPA: VWA domain-containing protein [Candidatus Poribacteria bacterium]|nr:VWA domain-containing protein [Candidatus Poribacteria bacterium]
MLGFRFRNLYRVRDINAFFISLCLHLIAFIITGFVLYSQKPIRDEEVVQLSFIDANELRPRRPKSHKPIEIKPIDPTERQNVTKEITRKIHDESASKFNEVIAQAPVPVIRNASVERNMEKTEVLPDVMTMVEGLRQDEIMLSKQMSSRNAPEAGDGMSSFRQRVRGSGAAGGGLGIARMTDVVDISFPQEDQLEGNTDIGAETYSPFGDALFNIAQHILTYNQTGYADIVFVLDTSLSMQDNIQKVADALFSMTNAYDKAGLDYRLGFVEFSVRRYGEKIEIDPLTSDPMLLQRRMRSLRISGNEHALDALWKALIYLEFRPEAEKHLILVTDEPATTGWTEKNAYYQRRDWVLQESGRQNVIVHVLGYNEYFQRQLAQRTNGLWQEIPGGQRPSSVVVQGTGLPTSRSSNWKLLKSFRDIARHIARTSDANSKISDAAVEIVIVLDYSLSMAGKIAALRQGFTEFIGTIDLFALDYSIGLMLFAEAKNAVNAIDGVTVLAQPTLTDPEKFMNLLTLPMGGDEHLIDAMVEGLPKIRFRQAQRVVFIITDEPSTGNYDVDEALDVCRSLNVQVDVLGPLPAGATNRMIAEGYQLPGDDFQSLVVNQTGGIFRLMPNSLAIADANQ